MTTGSGATRVLISGIEGFTGRYLAPTLAAAGYRVFGLHQRQESGQSDCLVADLLDPDAIAQVIEQVEPDVVVHLAAISFVGHSDRRSFYEVNLLGTLNLLQALAASGRPLRKVVLASSANIYGNTLADPLDESVTPAPANDYAVSKLAMEQMASLWFGRLPLIIVRPFNYTGVGQAEHFLLPKIVAHFRNRAPVLELGNLDVIRDFSDVRTVTDCYRRLIESSAAGRMFNVCSGRGTSLSQVLQMAERLTGHQPKIVVNPAYVRNNEVHRLVGSRQSLETTIGPIEDIPLAETLQWMLEAEA
jgi:nucleoside-diphosphate-sugar epimerase